MSLGMFAGILIGSLVTLWLGEAAMDLVHRMVDRVSGRRGRVNFELLLQKLSRLYWVAERAMSADRPSSSSCRPNSKSESRFRSSPGSAISLAKAG